MRSISIRLVVILSLIGVAQMLSFGTALAHTGEEAGTGHVIVEFGRWGLGVGGVLMATVLAFWIRAKVWPR